MTPVEIDLIETSWRRAEPVADTVARLFYRRLFSVAPETRERVSTSVCEQSDRLLAALDGLLEQLPWTEPTEAALEELDTAVQESWVWTLRQETGCENPLETARAWRSAIRSSAGQTFRSVALGKAALANA